MQRGEADETASRLMGAVVALALAGCERRRTTRMSRLDRKARQFGEGDTCRPSDVAGLSDNCLSPADGSRPASDFSQAQRARDNLLHQCGAASG